VKKLSQYFTSFRPRTQRSGNYSSLQLAVIVDSPEIVKSFIELGEGRIHCLEEDNILQFAMKCKSCHPRDTIIKNIVDSDPEYWNEGPSSDMNARLHFIPHREDMFEGARP
jgi:hypothetical protein